MKKLLFIVNPKAGKKSIASKVCDIVDIFNKANYEVTLRVSQDVNDIYNTITTSTHHDCIVCSGGDGSLNEMIRACKEIGYDLPIGYIPSGTVNDFAKTMHLSTDPIQCAKNIVKGKYSYCDVGSLNDMTFIYVAAFGALSDVSYTTPQENKNILGHSAYVLEGLKQLFDLPKFKVKLKSDTFEMEDEFCMGIVGNTKSIGSAEFFKKEKVDVSDGLFECLFVKNPSNVIEYQQIVHAILMNDYAHSSNVLCFKTKHLEVETQKEAAWTIDGEYGGTYQKVQIQNCEKAMKILR